MRRILAASFILLNLFSNAMAEQVGFKSPLGMHRVTLTQTREYKAGDTMKDSNDVSHTAYRVDFFDRDNRWILSTTWTDVYGWDTEKSPSTPEEIFKEFIWSPKEDFVLMPAEQWPQQSSANDGRKAIVLNKSLGWKSARSFLEDLVWLDDRRVIGNNRQHCDARIEIFNGNTGVTRTLKPFGLQNVNLVSYEMRKDPDGEITLRTLPDNCGSGSPGPFTQKCWTLNAQNESINPVTCPLSAGEPPSS
jgi:hypothetical protein